MLGALDMFAIGIGPSSSHTIGPMKAALQFVQLLDAKSILTKVVRIEVNLYGSLALTGEGHGTILAVINGLCGESPSKIESEVFLAKMDVVRQQQVLNLLGQHQITFNLEQDILLHKQEFLPEHANGMRFIAHIGNKGGMESIDFVVNHSLGNNFTDDSSDSNKIVAGKFSQEYFSIGGGFIVDKEQITHLGEMVDDSLAPPPYPFETADELFGLCEQHGLSVAQLVTQNELIRKSDAEVRDECLQIVEVMRASVQHGIINEGVLPGGLNVRRRAPGLYSKLNVPHVAESAHDQRLLAMAFAIGVNEENAAFGRVVTAPTNGSAGTIPGVLEYYVRYGSGVTQDKLVEFILTAGAIGMLYKLRASISAAEVGCQGEIGVACSMAAAALTAVMGGSLIQIAKAAEIAMEHSLGMTCDPIGGLVQVPCIERNGVAASRAIDIARLALLEDTPGIVSLDDVIKTMMQTGKDMGVRYKETALGGLAVNVVNC